VRRIDGVHTLRYTAPSRRARIARPRARSRAGRGAGRRWPHRSSGRCCRRGTLRFHSLIRASVRASSSCQLLAFARLTAPPRYARSHAWCSACRSSPSAWEVPQTGIVSVQRVPGLLSASPVDQVRPRLRVARRGHRLPAGVDTRRGPSCPGSGEQRRSTSSRSPLHLLGLAALPSSLCSVPSVMPRPRGGRACGARRSPSPRDLLACGPPTTASSPPAPAVRRSSTIAGPPGSVRAVPHRQRRQPPRRHRPCRPFCPYAVCTSSSTIAASRLIRARSSAWRAPSNKTFVFRCVLAH